MQTGRDLHKIFGSDKAVSVQQRLTHYADEVERKTPFMAALYFTMPTALTYQDGLLYAQFLHEFEGRT